MKVKLNIAAIRIAEALLKKPFGKFDLTDEEETTTIIYGMVLANNDESFSYDTFKTMLNQKNTAKIITNGVRREFEVIKQFSSEGKEDENPPYIGELASTLIVYGIDADFVNYKMRIFEITDYLKAIDERKKEQMEDSRFWTYLNILPHVGKKIKSPQDLITFPWEAQDKKLRDERELERISELFEKFIKS